MNMNADMRKGSLEIGDEVEKRLAEERTFAALKLQRKQRLETLIEKRKNNFLYLKRVHNGGCFWLNSVLTEHRDLNLHIFEKVQPMRAVMYYYLGLSISKLLDLQPGPVIIRAFAQLLEEWEYMFASVPMQGMKYVMARTSHYAYPQFMPAEGDQDQIRSTIFKFNNDVVFEYLLYPHVPFELDYLEVFHSLCDMLYSLYEKLWHEDSFSNVAVYETVVRLDARVKHFVINLVAKEFTETAISTVKDEVDDLRASLYNA
mmetsp:Transcript_3961/g.6197  ORF Transcript_3961/g.6197 Transcript_3961/m.6197 type:complete len:259 (+) Transcript_3961:63-839(+)